MAHDPQRYYAQLQEARRIGLRMTGAALEAFERLLADYAERLARLVTQAGDPFQLAQNRQALAIVDRVMEELAQDMARITNNSITITARRVAEIHATATNEILAAEGLGRLAISGSAIGSRTAASLLARPELSKAFVTIRPESRAAVDAILKRSAAQGVSGPQLARQLRVHIRGAEAIPDRYLLDRRRIGYDALRQMGLEPTRENLVATRKMAGQLANKANLIGRTEPMNAQHEARIQAAADSPVVEAVEWALSGAHPREDICDSIADDDLFGLGPGRYDPRAVPPRPHPRCLCYTVDVLLPVENWGQPRGAVPELRTNAAELAERWGFTPSEERQMAAVLETATTRQARRAA